MPNSGSYYFPSARRPQNTLYNMGPKTGSTRGGVRRKPADAIRASGVGQRALQGHRGPSGQADRVPSIHPIGCHRDTSTSVVGLPAKWLGKAAAPLGRAAARPLGLGPGTPRKRICSQAVGRGSAGRPMAESRPRETAYDNIWRHIQSRLPAPMGFVPFPGSPRRVYPLGVGDRTQVPAPRPATGRMATGRLFNTRCGLVGPQPTTPTEGLQKRRLCPGQGRTSVATGERVAGWTEGQPGRLRFIQRKRTLRLRGRKTIPRSSCNTWPLSLYQESPPTRIIHVLVGRSEQPQPLPELRSLGQRANRSTVYATPNRVCPVRATLCATLFRPT